MRRHMFLAALLGLAAAVAWPAVAGDFLFAQHGGQSPDPIAALIGNWSGRSVCADLARFPACHDERVVYRVTRSAKKPDAVTITADKIVDGKPETMGILDFDYDAAKGTLVNEFTRNGSRGRWEFRVKARVIEGVLLTLPDRAVARRVTVAKDE